MTYARARFANNNQLDTLPAAQISASSQLSAFPFSNTKIDSRFMVWKPAGNFSVTATNNLIYINDGADKTATIPVANYTYSTLATAIQTALNAVGTLWTCTYSTTTRSFTIGHTGSVTLRKTQATNAAWDMLGYTNLVDSAGTSFLADESRNHTHESVVWDFVGSRAGDFFACIGQITESFPISDIATITLKANSINNFTAAPFSATLTRTNDGVFAFNDSVASPNYRFWEFKFIDRTNTIGPEGFAISHLYLGDYDTLTSTNVATGLEKNLVDLTTKSSSASGASFFRQQSKRWEFKSMQIQQMTAAERLVFQTFLQIYGTHKAFYFSLDPGLVWSSTLDEFTKFVRFSENPRFTNLVRDIYTKGFELEEVV